MNSVHANRQLACTKGFTLVEVLLAITIATGMLVVVMYLYQQSAHIRLSVQQEADRISTVRLVMQRMSNELRSCQYFEHKKLGIKGTSDKIEMISTGVLEEGFWGSISSTSQVGAAKPRDAGGAGGAGGSATSAGGATGDGGAAARAALPRIQSEMDLRKISYGLKRSKPSTNSDPGSSGPGNSGGPTNFGSGNSPASGGRPGAAKGMGGGGLVVDGIWRGEQRLVMAEEEKKEEEKNPAAVVAGGEIVADEPEEAGGPLLTDRIRYLRFRYWDGKEWLDTWEAEQLPGGIEVTIGIEAMPEGMEAKDYPYEVFRRIIALPVRKVNDGDLHRPVVGAEESA